MLLPLNSIVLTVILQCQSLLKNNLFFINSDVYACTHICTLRPEGGVGFHRAGDCVLYYMTAGVLTPVLCKKREVLWTAEPPLYSLVSSLKIMLELVPPFKRCIFSIDETKCRMLYRISLQYTWKLWIYWLFRRTQNINQSQLTRLTPYHLATTPDSLNLNDTEYQKSTCMFFWLETPRWILVTGTQNKGREWMGSGRSRTMMWPESTRPSPQGIGTCISHGSLKEPHR